MNRAFVSANFVDEPKVYTVRDTVKMAKFTLVSNEYKSGRQVPIYFNCVAFGKTAEQVEGYSKKGTKAVAIGRFEVNEYTNKEGVEVKNWILNVDEISLIARRKSQKDEDEFTITIDEAIEGEGNDNSVPF